MTSLTRTLGLRDLTMLIVGCVIGSGIFLVPGAVLSQVDRRIGPALLVWLAGGVLSLLGALTYGELSAMKPRAGGLYVYIRECFGPLPAFLFGWALFFAIASGSVAALAVAFSDNLGQVIPLSPMGAKVISLSMIAVVTAVNVRGTRQSADLQNWTTAMKVIAILLMSGVLLLAGSGFEGSGAAVWPSRVDSSLMSGFGLAMVAVLWAYEGWQYGTYTAGETVDAKRNFPLGFLAGVLVLIAIYLIANVAYLAALGPDALAESKSAAAAAVSVVVGPNAAKLVAVGIALSIFSATNANVLTAPRVYYAMAGDGLFFRKLAEVHPRFKTPAFAVIAGSGWAAILAMLGDFQQLLTYVVFAGWIFYGLGAAAVFVYRKRVPAVERPYSVAGYPFTPLLFILAAGVLVINTAVTQFSAQRGRTIIAFAIILSGVPVYFLWRLRNRESAGRAAG